MEIYEKDSNGKIIHHYDSNTAIRGSNIKVETDDERWSYDAKTGKKVSHDENTSWGKTLHEQYDAVTGKEKSSDETNKNGTTHRAFDSTTGNLQQEDITNADKTHETIKYDSNGDKHSREKQYGNNGDAGKREWIYSKKTGKEVYSEFRAPDGTIKNRSNIDENGKWTSIED